MTGNFFLLKQRRCHETQMKPALNHEKLSEAKFATQNNFEKLSDNLFTCNIVCSPDKTPPAPLQPQGILEGHSQLSWRCPLGQLSCCCQQGQLGQLSQLGCPCQQFPPQVSLNPFRSKLDGHWKWPPALRGGSSVTQKLSLTI